MEIYIYLGIYIYFGLLVQWQYTAFALRRWEFDSPTVHRVYIASISAPIIIKIPSPPVTIDGHEIPDSGIGMGEAVGLVGGVVPDLGVAVGPAPGTEVGVGVGVVPDFGVAVGVAVEPDFVTVRTPGVLLMRTFWPSCLADAAVAGLKERL